MTSLSSRVGHLVMPDRLASVAWAAALCLALTGCSGGSSQPGGHATAPSSPAVPTDGPAAVAAVTSMWKTFFNGTVPIPRRLALLQDAPAFTPFVHKEEKTSIGTLVLKAAATVSSVTVQPNGHASVVFTILLGGKPLAKNLRGMAVFSGGAWKVSSATFCGLLKIAYGKKAGAIPAACAGQ
jgi:hypothetical protein